jgi:hypothetical protein
MLPNWRDDLTCVRHASCGAPLREKVIDVTRRLSKSALSLQVHAGRGDSITLGIENRDPITIVALVMKYKLVTVIAMRAGCHADPNETRWRMSLGRGVSVFAFDARSNFYTSAICSDCLGATQLRAK